MKRFFKNTFDFNSYDNAFEWVDQSESPPFYFDSSNVIYKKKVLVVRVCVNVNYVCSIDARINDILLFSNMNISEKSQNIQGHFLDQIDQLQLAAESVFQMNDFDEKVPVHKELLSHSKWDIIFESDFPDLSDVFYNDGKRFYFFGSTYSHFLKSEDIEQYFFCFFDEKGEEKVAFFPASKILLSPYDLDHQMQKRVLNLNLLSLSDFIKSGGVNFWWTGDEMFYRSYDFKEFFDGKTKKIDIYMKAE